MNVRRVVLMLLVTACGAGLATAQTEWVGDPANPVVPAPDPGAWDAQRYTTQVIEVDGTYHMFFVGRDPSIPNLQYFQVGHATSSDGVSWAMDPANPVVSWGQEGEWDDHGAHGGAVIHDGTEFRMWYVGSDGEVGRVGYATSPDGSIWTKYDGNPILDVGPDGSFDDQWVAPSEVIVRNGHYQMWYSSAKDVRPDDTDWRIGYAESDDGLSWIKHPTPVLEPGVGWDSWLAYAPSVVFDGAGYHMWYMGTSGSGDFGIGYAVSADGVDWTRYFGNPVIADQSGHPAVLYDGDSGTFTMWYTSIEDLSVKMATSECCTMFHLSFVPAAAHAAGAHGSFFVTDLDLSNSDAVPVEYELWWLPRGENNSEPTTSETFSLGAGMSVRYANVLAEVFDLSPDALGALAVASSSSRLLAMSRTYSLPEGGGAGTYGQSMPAITDTDMIYFGERRRILFGTEHADMRTNVGCVNGSPWTVAIDLELFDMEGTLLATEMMVLGPWGNEQINRIFADFAPTTGYVEVSTRLPSHVFYCYGSVLDNTTSDPTTIPPM